MRESTGNNAVVDLAKYRAALHQRRQKPDPQPVPEDLLDTIAYHLLMAGRAIAAHKNKQISQDA